MGRNWGVRRRALVSYSAGLFRLNRLHFPPPRWGLNCFSEPQGLRLLGRLSAGWELYSCAPSEQSQRRYRIAQFELNSDLTVRKVTAHSIPSCFLASGLRRSGVQGGVHTTFTFTLRMPGSCSIRDLTCALMLTCSGQPWAVRVMSMATSCLISSGLSLFVPMGFVPAGTGSKRTV